MSGATIKRTLAALLLIGIAAAAPAKEELLDLKADDDRLIAPMNVASLNRLSLAALGGTTGTLGTFLPLFDRRLDTLYTARENGPASISVIFHRAQLLHGIRLLLGDGRYEWSVAGAESQQDLESASGSYRFLVTARETNSVGVWQEVMLPSPASIKGLLINVRPLAGTEKVSIKEANLIAEQRLESLSLKASDNSIPLGQQSPLEVSAYFSGGEVRAASGKGLKWTIRPDAGARMTTHARVIGRRLGPIEVSASLGKLTSPPLQLQVVDAD